MSPERLETAAIAAPSTPGTDLGIAESEIRARLVARLLCGHLMTRTDPRRGERPEPRPPRGG